jgi:hypothetical protein
MRVLQLGNVRDLPASTLTYKVPGAVSPTSYTAPVSTGQKILNTFNQLLPTVVQTKQTVDILRNKTTAPGVINTTYAQQPGAGNPPTPGARVGLSTGAKIGIGVAAAAVVTAIAVAVTRKKK